MHYQRNRTARVKSSLAVPVTCIFVMLVFGSGTPLAQADNVSAEIFTATNDLQIELKDNGIRQSVSVVDFKSTTDTIEQMVNDIVSPNDAIIHAEQTTLTVAEQAALTAADEAQKERRFIKGEEESTLLAPFQAEMKRQRDALSLEMNTISESIPTPLVRLNVPLQYQNPILPNGCEVTALAMVLNFYGFDISNTTLSDDFLPKTQFIYRNTKRYGSSPDMAFIGEPREVKSSFYCFINPLITASNNYLHSISDTSFIPTDLTGADEQILVTELDRGNPVIVVTTMSFGKPLLYAPARWIIDDTGEIYTPFLNLHCVVLCGYDEENFYLADPIKGNIICKRSTLIDSYKEMNSRAMTFHKNS